MTDTTLGGIGSFLELLVPTQLEAGDEVILAMPATDPVHRLVAAGAGLHRWSATAQPGAGVPGEALALARILHAARPDVVHLHNDKAGLVGRLVIRGGRATVFQPHAWSFLAKEGALRRAALTWERAAARWAHVVLCVAEEERQLGERSGVAARYMVALNGVDLERFPARDGDERAAARARLGLAPRRPLAVCLGRLHRQKGQHLLLDAWPAVRDHVPDADLALVGDGPDRGALERRAVPGVRFVGQTGDVGSWLAAADVVAAPSRWEGLSLSVLEALASARSVVATGVPGMREVVAGAGAIVPAGDVERLAREIVARLLAPDLADAEGRTGRKRVEERHDRRRQAPAIAEAYDVVQELVGRRRADGRRAAA